MLIRNLLAANIADFYCNFEKNQHDLPKGRKRFNQICSLGIKPKLKTLKDHTISGTKVRYYSDSPSTKRPVMIFFHGGGFVLGSIASHDIICRRIAKYTGVNVLSVSYSLAPEHKYPVQINQAASVLESIFMSRPNYMSNGSIVLGGDSAGGTVAASLASKYFKRIQGLFLIYPMLDLSTQSQSIIKNGIKKNFLTKEMIHWFIGQYTNSKNDLYAPELSPIFTPKESLVPTFIATGTLDPFLDESKAFALKLENANVAHALITPKNAIHGFMQFPSSYGYRVVLNHFKDFIKSLD